MEHFYVTQRVVFTDPPPPMIFICSCGHEESAHVVHHETFYDYTSHGEVNEERLVETYPCRLCDGLCQNFEVAS